MVEALSSIRDSYGRVKIEGYCSDIKHSSMEVDMLRRTPFEEAELRGTLSPSGFVNNVRGLEAKKAYFLGTACNICGLYAGYTGKGSKTVLPSSATVKLDFRLVPDQNPRKVLRQLRSHLRNHSFSNVKVKELSGYPAAHSSPKHWLVSHTAKTAKMVYGKPPAIYPSSPGSGPAYLIIDELGIGTVATGVGYSGSRIHAPNENIRIEDYTLGIKHMIALLGTKR
jgi:acetylornithine deacetylase/succinyl-diaminopimelate desuccinylase-like protein